MKKRFLGIKIGKILIGLLCLAAAFTFWFFVKYAYISAEPIVESGSVSGIYEQ